MGIGTSISGSGGITLLLQTVFIFLALLPLPSITLITSNPNLQSHDPSLSSNNLTLEYPHPLGSDHNHYTDQWVLHIPGGSHRAHHIAAKHGFTNAGHMFTDYYHFIHPHIAKRSISPRHDIHELLTAEPGVRWHAQQTIKSRVKRDFLDLTSSTRGRRKSVKKYEPLFFNDPRWSSMWYLNRGPGLDMNVQEAWELGITGKGIVVTILDDGLEKDHPDIIRNYDPIASFDVNSLDMDPMPTYDLTDSNRHGTRCAGEVAAEANNNLCSVGIAYEASVGGVRMLDGDVTDAVEARSLSHSPQHVDIYSASWGPDDDGKTVDGPGELATRAFIEGITKGRQGKGSIFVWASGNGGRDHDNCNCDGYTNSIWTLSISSATENGLVPWYSEACSSTLATTYSSGGTGEKQIVTIDLHHSCTSSHTGTSASAPLAAGICALALQANTNLTWRDMQHIVVRTARPQNLFAPDWATNGIGRNVSHSFGYGLMDAGAMVKLAKKWINVPEQNKCEVRAPYTDKNIPAKSKVTLELKVTDCPGVNFLEHVQAKVTLISGRRGDLQIYLISPSGTKSVLLAHRRHDLNRSGFTDWPFMSVHCWGENPVGKWILEIHNEGRYAGRTVLKRWSLVLYGTEQNLNNELPTESKPKLVIPVSISPILTTASNKLKPIYPKTTRKPVIVKEEDIPRKPSRQRPFKTKVFTKKQKTMTQNGSDIDGDFRLTSTAYNPFGFSHVTKSTNTKPTRETVTAIPENFNSSTNEDIEGKLQTWSLVAHGITEDPNNEENIEVKPTAGIVSPPFQSINPSLIEFDGSENKIVVDTSNIHNPPHLSSSATEVADIPGILTSSANTCIKESSTGNCLACAFGFVLFKHTCILTCPDHYFAKLKSPSKEVDVPSKICLPCHSSCKTCSSSSDMSCLSCENGFTLMKRIDEKNRVLLRCNLDADLLFENNEIDYMNYWYKVLVIISLLTASIIVLVLISCYWKKNLESPSLFNSWLEKRSYIPVSPNDDGDASPMNAIEVDVDVTYASQIHSTKELNLNPETIPFTNPENTSIT